MSDDVDSIFFKYCLLKAESARLIVVWKHTVLKEEVRVQNNLGWYERSYNAYLSRKVTQLQSYNQVEK
jgi:hypothetical protein